MAYTTINKSSDYFNTKLYTGNGGTQSIAGVGFQPDFCWFKRRDTGNSNHALLDAVRGVTKFIQSNTNTAEATSSNYLTSFNSDGFSLAGDGDVNENNANHCSWNWKAGGGQGSSNTDGSINTTYTSANTTAGFSISKYTGTGSGATVGHGLGATPDMIFWKRLDNSAGSVNWIVQSPLLDNRNKLVLNTTEAKSYNSSFANVDNWSNSVFTLGTYEGQNSSGGTYISYSFAEKTGYSKFGSYVGNGNANGSFIYTGFKPAFVMVKQTNASGEDWFICDTKREGYNAENNRLLPNLSSAESTDSPIDILSNSFKARLSGANVNGSGSTYIYMAFAGAPLVGTNNVPCTAR